jgi:hypothetical protein
MGYLVGQFLSRFLPEHHYQQGDARDVLKSATGMIATLVALVLGLLVASAKSTFDGATDTMNLGGARLIQIDRLLRKYGPDAEPARKNLRKLLAEIVDRIDNPDLAFNERMKRDERAPEGTFDERIAAPIQALAPASEEKKKNQQQAIDLLTSLADARWLMMERATNKLPLPFLVLLFFWLAVLFAGFGILSPRNMTVHCAFAICALSMAGAIYMIMEMNDPLDGTLRVSTAPLKVGLSLMGE